MSGRKLSQHCPYTSYLGKHPEVWAYPDVVTLMPLGRGRAPGKLCTVAIGLRAAWPSLRESHASLLGCG